MPTHVSLEDLKRERDNLSFVLDALSRVDTWNVEDIEKLKSAIQSLRSHTQSVAEQIRRIEDRQASSARRLKWLNAILYFVAGLSVLHLVVQAHIDFVPKFAICAVLVLAFMKATPHTQWKRLLLLFLIPLTCVLVAFSVRPVRELLEQYTTPMTVLSLAYAILFALFNNPTDAQLKR